MATRHVLTVNQVLEIMLRWLEIRDWEKAFLNVIPKRKLPEMQGGQDVESEEVGDGQDLSDQEDQESIEIVENAEIDKHEGGEDLDPGESKDTQGSI